MNTLIIAAVIFLAIIFYLFKTSKNFFFFQSKEDLAICREMLITAYRSYGRSLDAINSVLKAYDYYCVNPNNYDGSTIVRDLFDIKYKGNRLCGSSLEHDYIWQVFKANLNWIKNYKSNYKFYNSLLSNGKPAMVGWLIGLHIIGTFYVPYMYLKTKLK